MQELRRRKNQKLVVTDRQEEILIGSLLGDAHITARGQIQFEQSDKQREYLLWKHTELSSISYKNISLVKRFDKRFQREYGSYRFWTRQYFQSWRKRFYPNGKKLIPRDIQLTPRVVAIWYMDDGSYSDHKCIISTDSFLIKDVKHLQYLLEKTFGIRSTLKNKLKIMIKKESFQIFFQLISPYIISSMRYKIFDPVTTSRDFKKPRDPAQRDNTSVPRSFGVKV